MAVITVDLGGNVFGGSDPDPFSWEVLLMTGSVTGGEELLGEKTTVETDESGHFVLTADSVPGLGDLSITIEGDASPDGFTGTYTIPGLAEGTFKATPDS